MVRRRQKVHIAWSVSELIRVMYVPETPQTLLTAGMYICTYSHELLLSVRAVPVPVPVMMIMIIWHLLKLGECFGGAQPSRGNVLLRLSRGTRPRSWQWKCNSAIYTSVFTFETCGGRGGLRVLFPHWGSVQVRLLVSHGLYSCVHAFGLCCLHLVLLVCTQYRYVSIC